MRFLAYPLVGLIRLYQLLLSPYLPPSCRFLPGCSSYAAEALLRHGPLVGLWLAVRRIARCHPWGGFGYDPVPEPKDRQRRHEADPRMTSRGGWA